MHGARPVGRVHSAIFCVSVRRLPIHPAGHPPTPGIPHAVIWSCPPQWTCVPRSPCRCFPGGAASGPSPAHPGGIWLSRGLYSCIPPSGRSHRLAPGPDCCPATHSSSGQTGTASARATRPGEETKSGRGKPYLQPEGDQSWDLSLSTTPWGPRSKPSVSPRRVCPASRPLGWKSLRTGSSLWGLALWTVRKGHTAQKLRTPATPREVGTSPAERSRSWHLQGCGGLGADTWALDSPGPRSPLLIHILKPSLCSPET